MDNNVSNVSASPTDGNMPQTTKKKRETATEKYTRLKAIKKSQRTPEQEIELLQAKKAIDDAAINAKIREVKRNAAQAKQDAIMKNLVENGITTENGVKGLLRIRQILHDNHINTEGELRRLFERIKSGYPQLLSVQ